MTSVFRVLNVVWTPLQRFVSWQRRIGNRNGTDDARRAQAARLLSLQTGPPIGSHPDIASDKCRYRMYLLSQPCREIALRWPTGEPREGISSVRIL